MAMFLSVIGEDALEMFDGMDFTPETDRQILSKVGEKFEEFCIGEANETYERFIFNRRDQEENESIDQYVTVLRKLAQTCNFCSCLHDSLIRDRLVLGITCRDDLIRKKLLQEKKLSVSHAIDVGRSGETTNIRLKEIKNKTPISETDDEVNAVKKSDFAGGNTDEATAQRMDKLAGNVAVGIIFLKFASKEIRAKSLSQLTW